METFRKLTELFEKADSDESGTLTCDELKAVVGEEGVMETLAELDIKTHEIEWLFDILDTDGNRILSIDEFVSGMLHVKSSEQARQLFQVQHTLLKEVRRMRSLPGFRKAIRERQGTKLGLEDAGGVVRHPELAE